MTSLGYHGSTKVTMKDPGSWNEFSLSNCVWCMGLYIYIYINIILYNTVCVSISSGSSQAERNPSWPQSCQATMRFRSLAWIWTRRSRRRTTDVTTLPQGMSDYLSITLLILLRCLPPNHSWYKRLSFFRVVMTPWFNIFSHFVLCPTALSFTRCCKLRIWLFFPWFSSQSGA